MSTLRERVAVVLCVAACAAPSTRAPHEAANVNECDACPDAPETFPSGVISIRPVLLFDKQSTKIASVGQPLVDEVAHVLLANKDSLELVAVVGHASRDEADADVIALARANSVKQLLVSQGIDAVHLETHGVGARKPFDEKDAPLNRRVEFVVLRANGREQIRLNGDAIEQVGATDSTRKPVCRARPAACKRQR